MRYFTIPDQESVPKDKTVLLKRSELREIIDTARRECVDPACECHPWFAEWRKQITEPIP